MQAVFCHTIKTQQCLTVWAQLPIEGCTESRVGRALLTGWADMLWLFLLLSLPACAHMLTPGVKVRCLPQSPSSTSLRQGVSLSQEVTNWASLGPGATCLHPSHRPVLRLELDATLLLQRLLCGYGIKLSAVRLALNPVSHLPRPIIPFLS